MIFCKHCGKQVKVGRKMDIEVKLWEHLRDTHPKEFKEQEDKMIDEIFDDNFTSDTPEVDVREYL